ncbi:MAG: hypothetical protein J6D25_05295 [Eggerthellaceae bacterium]|nr:hypothetical protein [Eggerthellaceae bacterium]
MKVLVIGSGAREHAIAHTLLRGASVDEVTVAPGNPGMELDEGIRTLQLNPSNQAALIDFVRNNDYDWVFVGPEVPLIEGIVDAFKEAGIKAFGPSKAAAQIEGSKDFAKQLMERHGIPTAAYRTFDESPVAIPDAIAEQAQTAESADEIEPFNNLAPASEKLMPELADIRTWLEGQPGVESALLCGSGSCTFAVCDDFATACQVVADARKRGLWARATSFGSARAIVVSS